MTNEAKSEEKESNANTKDTNLIQTRLRALDHNIDRC